MIREGRSGPIVVETEQYGALYLRPSLVVRDSLYLSRLNETGVAPREFTVQAVSRLVYFPEIGVQEVRSWDDGLLARVASTWAATKPRSEWLLSEELPPFEAFRQGHTVYADTIGRQMADSLRDIYAPAFKQSLEALDAWTDALNRQLADTNRLILASVRSGVGLVAEAALGSVLENLSSIVASVTLDIDVGRLFPSLPGLSDLWPRREGLQRAAGALDEGGYRFMRGQWLLSEIAQFVGIDQVTPRVRHAAITNRLLGLTRSDDFTARSNSYFSTSGVLRRRWRIVKQAYAAHRKREYALSIPALLAQVEGMFTDALILKNMAIRQDNKLYARDSDGNLKLGRKGKPVRLHGLGQKVQNSRFREDDILRDLVGFFTSTLIPERNDIMHGSTTDYGRAKLSVQLVLSTYLLAAEFAEFEDGS